MTRSEQHRRRAVDEDDPVVKLSGVLMRLEGNDPLTIEVRHLLATEVRSAREIIERPSRDPIQRQIETGVMVICRCTVMVPFNHPDGTPDRRARILDPVGYHWGIGELHDGLMRRMTRDQARDTHQHEDTTA